MRKYWIGSIFALVLTSMSPIALAQGSPPPSVLHGFASFRPGSMPECRSTGFLNNTANGRSMPVFNTTT